MGDHGPIGTKTPESSGKHLDDLLNSTDEVYESVSSDQRPETLVPEQGQMVVSVNTGPNRNTTPQPITGGQDQTMPNTTQTTQEAQKGAIMGNQSGQPIGTNHKIFGRVRLQKGLPIDSSKLAQTHGQGELMLAYTLAEDCPKPQREAYRNFILTRFARQQSYSGWQAGVRTQERMIKSHKLITNIGLAVTNIDFMKAAEVGVNFEREAFNKSADKAQYEAQMSNKTEGFFRRRLANEQNLRSNLQAQADAQAHTTMPQHIAGVQGQGESTPQAPLHPIQVTPHDISNARKANPKLASLTDEQLHVFIVQIKQRQITAAMKELNVRQAQEPRSTLSSKFKLTAAMSSCLLIHSTISKDNTKGDDALIASLFADLGDRLNSCSRKSRKNKPET